MKSSSQQKRYVENVDFLLGTNPIAGVMRFWQNTNQKLPLNFIKHTASSVGGSYTIPDSSFYFLLAVTADEAYSETFNDYGGTGPATLAGTHEVPLWNRAYAGPNPTSIAGHQFEPDVYYWLPGSGPTIQFDFGGIAGGPSGAVNFYYAALDPLGALLSSKAKSAGTGAFVPVSALRLTFENELGNGSEYDTDGDFTDQQIVYPHYAGVGSPNLDLGTTGGIPDILPEVVGSYPVHPGGDADFVDMIAAIFHSLPQAGIGGASNIGPAQIGLSCYDYPGAVQAYAEGDLESYTQRPLKFRLPNVAGNFLVVAGGNGAVTPSDTAGNTYTSLGAASGQLWYATAVASPNNEVNISTSMTYGWQHAAVEISGIDTLDHTAMVDNSDTISIETTQRPGTAAFILVWVNMAGANPTVPHWELLLGGSGSVSFKMFKRTVYQPGTYTLTVIGAAYSIAAISFKSSQAVPYAQPLGDILDHTSLELVRDQDRANGLWGSLLMDSQKKASDWLGEIYAAANAVPVWSGFKLKSVPYSEASAIGNGSVYDAPTAAGPVAELQIQDFVGDASTPPVTVERVAQVDVPNLLQIQHPNRASDYADVVVSEPETAAIAMYGPRKDSPRQLRCVYDVAVARMILGIMVRHRNYQRNTYKFTLNARWQLLEPMDLVTIPAAAMMALPDPNQAGVPDVPVRLTRVEEDENFNLSCEAEDFIYGCHAPSSLPVTAYPEITPVVSNATVVGADPGRVNQPVFLEPVPRLAGTGVGAELWAVVSGSGGVGFTPLSRDGWVATADSEHYGFDGNYLASRVYDGILKRYWLSDNSALPHWLAIDMGVAQTFNAIQIIPPQDTTVYNPGTIELYVSDDGATWGSAVETISPLPATEAAVSWVLSATYTKRYIKLNVTSAATATVGMDEVYVGTGVANLGNYGGCVAYLSTDGGLSYNAVSTLQGSAVTGELVSDWPAAADPDTANDLVVDLTESLGALDTYEVADEDNFVYPCYAAPRMLERIGWAASAQTTYDDPLTLASLAIDGNPTTYWESSFVALPQWLAIDMAVARRFNYLTILPEAGGGNTVGQVDLYVSDDGITWGSIVETKTFTSTDGSLQTWVLSAGYNKRYIKLNIVTSPNSDGRVAIAEVNVGVAPLAGLIPYELMTYSIQSLGTPAYNYTLVATGGNKLRRAVFGAPQSGLGVDHPAGSRFAFLGAGALGILKLPMDPRWIGVELHFKFTAFNRLGGGLQALADVGDYTYTPTGFPAGAVNPNAVNYTNTPAADLSQTNATHLAMAQTSTQFPSNTVNYNARTFTIADPGAGNVVIYYVTIYDPYYLGDTGALTNLTAYCEDTQAKVGLPGYTFMGAVYAQHSDFANDVIIPGGWPPSQLFLVNGV